MIYPHYLLFIRRFGSQFVLKVDHFLIVKKEFLFWRTHFDLLLQFHEKQLINEEKLLPMFLIRFIHFIYLFFFQIKAILILLFRTFESKIGSFFNLPRNFEIKTKPCHSCRFCRERWEIKTKPYFTFKRPKQLS